MTGGMHFLADIWGQVGHISERDFERDAQRVCWNSKSIWWVSWPRRNAASYQPRNLNSSQVLDNFLVWNPTWNCVFFWLGVNWFPVGEQQEHWSFLLVIATPRLAEKLRKVCMSACFKWYFTLWSFFDFKIHVDLWKRLVDVQAVGAMLSKQSWAVSKLV